MNKIIVFFLLFLTITSCQDELLEFSCNPKVNEFVKSNILLLSQIDLDEFLSMSTLQQRAAYRSYSPEKRLELWTEKLEKVLFLESWTEQEALHIEDLINYLNIETFTKYEEDNLTIVGNEVYAINWQDYALRVLKWDKGRLAFVISSLYLSETDYNNSLSQVIASTSRTKDFPVYDCGCNIGTDFCGSTTCQSSGCNLTSGGCGWLWMGNCDGECF